MQFSYRLLTVLYICGTISQSQLFQDNSEGEGEVLQSFRFDSPQIEPVGSISPERAQVDGFSSSSSGAALNAHLSQPLSDPEQPVPVDLGFTQGAVVGGPAAAAFDFAGLDSFGYLAQQPEQSISQSHQAQADPLESGQDQGRNLQPASDQIALDCDSSSARNAQEVLDYPPGLQAEPPGRRAKIRRLRPRQSNVCLAQHPSDNNPSEISTETEISIDNPNPAFYPGGWLQRAQDVIAGVRSRKLKQCPRNTVTLCCNGPQAGLDVRDCAFCMCLGTGFLPFVIRPRGTGSANLDVVGAMREPRCYNGGIWCCSRLSVSLNSFINFFLPSSTSSVIKDMQAWPAKLHSSVVSIIAAELEENRQNLCGALLPPKRHVISSSFREGYTRLYITSNGIHRTEKQKGREHLHQPRSMTQASFSCVKYSSILWTYISFARAELISSPLLV